MSLAGVLLSFLQMLLTVAIIIVIAYDLLLAAKVVIGEIDANVFYWGRVVVGLICLIVVAAWLLFPTFRLH